MPIFVGDKPILRVYNKDVKIKEIRKGTELTGGLYEITYINKGPKQVTTGWGTNKNIPEYVGGYPNDSKNDFYLYIPADATAAEAKAVLGNKNGYKSHSEGGFEDNDCFNYIPAITKDFHKDFTLFCKGRQRRYLYSGVGKYDKTERILVDYVGVPE